MPYQREVQAVIKPPKKVRIGGKLWDIRHDNRLDDDGEMGNTLGYKCLITYGRDAMASLQQFQDTILHECKHAVMYETGLGIELKNDDHITEEMIVRRSATMELAMFRDNPKLMAFLLAADL